MKLRRVVSLGLGLKEFKIDQNVVKVGVHAYPMDIQIYDQVWILRIWSKVKLHRVILLGFGLKELKIAMNIMKVGMHSYLSNGHPNLWSNFNSEKLVRSETPSCIFAKVGLEGVQIARTIAKVGVHVFISNGHPNLWSNFNSENLVKSETPSSDFAKVWLKGLSNNSQHHESFHALLSN